MNREPSGLRRRRGCSPGSTDTWPPRRAIRPEPPIAGWRLTETSPVSTQTAPDDPVEKRVGTVGRVHPWVEVKVVDRSAKGEKRPMVDLSRAAAERLDFVRQGTARVTAEVLAWGAAPR